MRSLQRLLSVRVGVVLFLPILPLVDEWGVGIGNWGLGIGDWELGIGKTLTQSPVPSPQSPAPISPVS
ncbi:hypothetical protein NDI42_15080 [Funiculus sociatus GB2-C1]